MGAIRFTTTQLRGLHAVRKQDDLPHWMISAELGRHLGPEFARLFAEPTARDNDNIDWYVPARPEPTPVATLPSDRQVAIRARADEMIAAIGDLAARLEAQSANGREVASRLRDATVYPPGDLWLYLGSPLIVNWGFRLDSASVRRDTEILIPLTPAPPPPPPPEPPPPPLQARAVRPLAPIFAALALWLVFAALIVRLYGDFLPACGLKAPMAAFAGSVGFCRASAGDPALVAEGLRLQRQFDQLELQLVERRQACAAPTRRASLNPRVRVAYAAPGAAPVQP